MQFGRRRPPEQYRDLREIEASFRELKSTVKVRPMYHWNPERIRAHVLICFLALVIERSMRLTLRRANNKKKPKTVLESLNSLRRVAARTTGGHIHGLTVTTQEQLSLFKDLGVSPPKAADVS